MAKTSSGSVSVSNNKTTKTMTTKRLGQTSMTDFFRSKRPCLLTSSVCNDHDEDSANDGDENRDDSTYNSSSLCQSLIKSCRDDDSNIISGVDSYNIDGVKMDDSAISTTNNNNNNSSNNNDGQKNRNDDNRSSSSSKSLTESCRDDDDSHGLDTIDTYRTECDNSNDSNVHSGRHSFHLSTSFSQSTSQNNNNNNNNEDNSNDGKHLTHNENKERYRHSHLSLLSSSSSSSSLPVLTASSSSESDRERNITTEKEEDSTTAEDDQEEGSAVDEDFGLEKDNESSYDDDDEEEEDEDYIEDEENVEEEEYSPEEEEEFLRQEEWKVPSTTSGEFLLIKKLDEKFITITPKCTDPVIESIMDKYAEIVANRIKELRSERKYIYVDPTSDRAFFCAIKWNKVKNARLSCIYAWFDDDGNLLKIGAAGHLFNRINHKDSGYTSGWFLVLVDLDKLPMEFDVEVGRLFFHMVTELHDDQRVPDYFRARMDIILNRDGYRDGSKKCGVRKLMELALFKISGCSRGNSKEFGMTIPHWDKWKAKADEITAAFDKQVKEVIGDHEFKHVMLASWETYYHFIGLLSTNPCLYSCMAGYEVDMTEIDPMPRPAFPNAKNAEEGFAVPSSPEDIQYGLQKVKSTLDALGPGNIADLDQNNNLLGSGGMDKELKRRGFVLRGVYFNGQCRSYVNEELKCVARVWMPWSIAGDSRPFVTDKYRIERSIILQGLHGHLRNQGLKSYGSPLIGVWFFLHTKNACNLPLRTASANHRDAITPPNVYAIRDTRLNKTPENDKDYPTSDLNRRIVKGYDKSAESTDGTKRSNDHSMYHYALNLRGSYNYQNKIDEVDSIQLLHSELTAILSAGGQQDPSKPFEIFWPKLKSVDDELHKPLFRYHRSLKRNAGNSQASAATNDRKVYNNNIYREIYNLCPSEEHPPVEFYVIKENRDVFEMGDDDCPQTVRGGRRSFNIACETLKNPFKPSNRTTASSQSQTQKQTSHMTRVSPPPGLKLEICRHSKKDPANFGIWKKCFVGYW